MFLYKYRPINKWTLSGLSDKTIHFRCPNYFNDPFDSKLNLYADGNNEDWKKLQQLENCSDQELDYYKELFKKDIDPAPLIKNVRVSCFSEISDNILMWSHYSDCHTGICLKFKFDFSQEFNEGSFLFHEKDFNNYFIGVSPKIGVCFPVNYSENMPSPINYLKFNIDDIKQFMLTKSIHWAYEKEWRIVTTDKNLKVDNPRFEDGQLQAIIFGLKCSQSDINLVKNIVANQNLEFYKAVVSKNEYKVDIAPL